MDTLDPHTSPPDASRQAASTPEPTGTRSPVGRAVMCPGCGAENRANRLFCANCGVYLRGEEDTWEDLPPPGWLEEPSPAPTGNYPHGAPDTGTGGASAHQAPPRVSSASAAPPPLPPSWETPPIWGPPPAPQYAGGPGSRRRGHTLGVVLIVLLAAAVFAVVVSVRYVYEQAADGSATGTTTASSTPPTTGSGGQESSTTTSATVPSTGSTAAGGGTLVEPSDISASSSLPSESGNTYRAANLVDGDTTTAWSEGADGAGEGEWVEVRFDAPLTLTALEIANGYQKDRRRFEGNPRVLELRLRYTDGTVQDVRLYDDQGWQFVTPEPVTTASLRLTIVSVYPGDTWDDASLSELRIFGRE